MNGTQYFANRYQEVDVNTATPLQLVVMLYDAAVNSLEKAREQMQRNDIAGRTKEVNKCVAIISELQSSLNMKEGGEIASGLNRLYDYMKGTLFKAGLDQDPGLIAEVEGLLSNLRSAWRQIASGKAAQAAQVDVAIPAVADFAGLQQASADAIMKSFSISA
ncbi:MAG: flagellar export chaperone FliS [Acidobacteriota bacterium]|jgi:flagellar protein FliS|nr:flagellar export chaperone FliS [Acidobacteriota bacterium]